MENRETQLVRNLPPEALQQDGTAGERRQVSTSEIIDVSVGVELRCWESASDKKPTGGTP